MAMKIEASQHASVLLTPDETATELRLHPVTLKVARRNKSLDLPFVRIGGVVRYRREDIDAFIERHLEGGGE